jgi:hypothetical protein
VGFGLGYTIKYLRGAAVFGLGTTNQYLRRSASGAAGNGLGTTAKYLRRPGHHDQVPATHNERRRA